MLPTFTEIADRCWVLAWDGPHTGLHVNVSLIAGERGLVVVDTHSSDAAAREVLQAVRRVSSAPLLAAVNTHAHFDHALGNAVFSAAGAELVCHDEAATEMPTHLADIRQQAAAEPDEPGHRELLETADVVPTRTFSSALPLDLGDRQVELIHPGAGHTAGDLVVRLPDTQGASEVLLAGDLVEQAGEAIPGYGSDCWPMEWPRSLDLVLGLVSESTVVVPGHGSPVDRDFVTEQRASIGIVAETIRDLAGRGVPLDQAVSAGDWPWPAERLVDAVRRGYEQLPRGARQLRLV